MKTQKWAKVAVTAMLPVTSLSGSAAEQLPAEDQLAGKVNLPGEPKEEKAKDPGESLPTEVGIVSFKVTCLESAFFEVEKAKTNLALRKCSEAAKNLETGRQIVMEIVKGDIQAAEKLSRTKFALDEIQRLEVLNLEAWAGELEQAAKKVGEADGYRQAREKLRAMLAIKDSGITAEKRDQLEAKVKELDAAYEKQRAKDAIAFISEPNYDVNREIANLHREAQFLYEKKRYAEASDKIEQILAKRPDDETAKTLLAKINDIQKPIKKPQASPTP